MNIVLIGPDRDQQGGIATVINNILDNTRFDDTNIFFYSSWRSGCTLFKIIYSFVQIILFPIFLNKCKVDIVYIHFAHNGSFVRKKIYAYIAKMFNKKVVMHAHSSSFDIYFDKLSSKKKQRTISFFATKCDGLIVLGINWKFFYKNILKVQENKIYILSNAVSCKSNIAYDTNSKIITMFGRLCKRKGTYDLLEVAQKCGDANLPVVFELYGDGEIEEFKKLIIENNLTNVHLNGWVTGEDKVASMARASLNILPSYNEGLPMAILESMALGVPNISTSIGSISEVIVDKENGYLMSPGDNECLYQCIRFYLTESSIEYRGNMSRMARYQIETNFNINDYGNKLEHIFKKIL